jgi:photosystem II stability/assembly factor-like uncharacterized protein
MDSPYEGSFFGLLGLSTRTMLLYGLRGHVFRTTNAGESWTELQAPMPVLLADAIRTAAGHVVFAGQGEHFFISYDAGRSLEHWRVPVQGASALVEVPDGAIIAVGLNGVHRLSPPRGKRPGENP